MPSAHGQKAPHPLLMEPTYWRQRLSELDLSEPSLLIVPRPDLTSHVLEVGEIRMRAHDGLRIWGMLGRCRLAGETMPVRIRLVPPGHPLEIDREAIKDGSVEFVLQQPPGRRLEDRVLDVMRAFRTAAGLAGVDEEAVRLVHQGEKPVPDEFLIAKELLAEGLES